MQQQERLAVGASPDPSFDLQFYLQSDPTCQLWTVSYPLPTTLACELVGWVRSRDLSQLSLTGVKRLVGKYLRNRGLPSRVRPVEVRLTGNRDFPAPVTLQLASLKGRVLTDRELSTALFGWAVGVPPGFELSLQREILQGRLELIPAINLTYPGPPRCSRCGSLQITTAPCTLCGYTECYLCPDCAEIGPLRGCTPLFRLKEPVEIDRIIEVPLRQDIPTLTRGQADLLTGLLAFIQSDQTYCLVDAVCGAGKGLIILELLAHILDQGYLLPILFTTPRRSVLTEWADRFQEVLGRENVSVLYGGRHEYRTQAPVIMATLPQLYRFYQHFRLVIIDEADAFPLCPDSHFWPIIRRTQANSSQQILFTATPEALPTLPEPVCRLSLPVRFHLQPHPLPRIEVAGGLDQMLERTGQIVGRWLRETSVKVFLYVPTKSLGKKVYLHLTKNEYLVTLITFFYADMSDFAEKLAEFRTGRIRLAITTTVLERGLTVSPCTVLVFGADHRNFSVATLVQMAGRVGRSATASQGEVVFLTQSGQKGKPHEAVAFIETKNQEAAGKGYLAWAERSGAY